MSALYERETWKVDTHKMKISSLIFKLKRMRKFNGDVNVCISSDDFFDDVELVKDVEMRSRKDWDEQSEQFYCCIIRPRSSGDSNKN